MMESGANDKIRNSESNADQTPDTKSLSLGLNLTVGFVVFALIGYKIDQLKGGGRAFTLFGVLLGFFYGGYEVWKIIRKKN